MVSAVAAVLLLGVAGFFFEAASAPRGDVASAPEMAEARHRYLTKMGGLHADLKKAVANDGTFVRLAEEPSPKPENRPAATASEMAKQKGEALLQELRKNTRGPEAEKAWRRADDGKYKSYGGVPGSGVTENERAESGDQWKSRFAAPAENKKVEDQIAALDGAAAPPVQGDWYFKPGTAAAGSDGAAGKAAMPTARDKERIQEQDATKRPAPAQDPQASQRKIIRQGEIEFEVESFDSTVDKVVRIAAEEHGYVATVNSDRLPNGKVKGTIVLRVPPESLDRLVLKLRALGDLKSQRITSEDVTKKYYDLESRLKAARTMETRLIEIIKTGKGEIKDILLAEKELGEWREKIEIFEGEIRFYSNLVSLSTLTLTLVEKDIKSPSLVTVTETVDTGIESEDVPAADKNLRTLIADAKGRITSSDLKKLAADQFSLNIACEVPPENAGVLRDRLGQLGRVARLDVQTATSDNGTGRPIDGKVKRSDTVFRISVYNTTNVQPRETSHLALACRDVEAAYKAIVASVGQAGGRVIQSSLNRLKADQVDGLVQFDVPVDKGEAVLIGLRGHGDVMSSKAIENPDSANVTKSKKGFHVVLLAMAHVAARETTTLRFAAVNVAETQRKLQDLVLDKKGRILDARLNEDSRDNVTATLDLEIPRDERPALDALLKASGETLSQNVQRAPDADRVVDSKIRLILSLQTVASVGPRRIVKLGVEASDVEAASERITKAVTEGGGQLVDNQNSRDPNGRTIAYLVYEAPLPALAGFVDQIRKAGTVRVEETRRNPLAPESGLAIGRIELTLSNEDPLIGRDAGFAAQMRDALRSVVGAAGFSLKFILIGALIVVPWVLIVWFGWKLARRVRSGVQRPT